MTFKVRADINAVQARLAAITKAGGSIQPALAAFGGVILNRIRLGFRLGRSPFGQAWLGLKFRQGQPLVNNGLLRKSITLQQQQNGVVIGTNLVQAPVHQFGAVIKPKTASRLVFPGPGGLIFARQVTIPARPFMPLTAAGDAQLPASWAQSGLDAMQKALDL